VHGIQIAENIFDAIYDIGVTPQASKYLGGTRLGG